MGHSVQKVHFWLFWGGVLKGPSIINLTGPILLPSWEYQSRSIHIKYGTIQYRFYELSLEWWNVCKRNRNGGNIMTTKPHLNPSVHLYEGHTSTWMCIYLQFWQFVGPRRALNNQSGPILLPNNHLTFINLHYKYETNESHKDFWVEIQDIKKHNLFHTLGGGGSWGGGGLLMKNSSQSKQFNIYTTM